MSASIPSAYTTKPKGADYLDPRVLAQASSVELRARMIMDGVMAGSHRSPQLGASTDFARHKAYVPGDDLRALDWKLLARTDKLFIKQFHKETDLDVALLVDASGSMGYRGERSPWRKIDQAAACAAALAYTALDCRDRVSLTCFGDRQVRQLRPSGTRGHLNTVVDALSACELAFADSDQPVGEGSLRGRTRIPEMMTQAAAGLKRRSLVFVFSDFFDEPAGVKEGLGRLRFAKHDVVLVQVMDRAEVEFPFRQLSEFHGLEGEGRLNLDPVAIREAYLEALAAHQEELRATARRSLCDVLPLVSDEPLGPVLGRFLAMRAARKK